MVTAEDLSRNVANHRINRIKRIFKWAVSEELIPPSVYESIRTVDGLRYGRTNARETDPVKPVALEHVTAVYEHVAPQVAAMIRVQLLTAMRPCEVVAMRRGDIDTSGAVGSTSSNTTRIAGGGSAALFRLVHRPRSCSNRLWIDRRTSTCSARERPKLIETRNGELPDKRPSHRPSGNGDQNPLPSEPNASVTTWHLTAERSPTASKRPIALDPQTIRFRPGILFSCVMRGRRNCDVSSAWKRHKSCWDTPGQMSPRFTPSGTSRRRSILLVSAVRAKCEREFSHVERYQLRDR